MDTNSSLTNAQVLAAAALAQGNTATKSAELAGVDRSTLYKWRKTNPEFRKAYCDSRYEAIAEELDKLSELSTIALDQLHDLMTKPDTPATVRLKACLAVLTRLKNTEETGWAVAHASKEDQLRERDRRFLANERANSPTFHTPQTFSPLRSNKGRNEPCECGSGQKYKRCCLNKPQSAAA